MTPVFKIVSVKMNHVWKSSISPVLDLNVNYKLFLRRRRILCFRNTISVRKLESEPGTIRNFNSHCHICIDSFRAQVVQDSRNLIIYNLFYWHFCPKLTKWQSLTLVISNIHISCIIHREAWGWQNRVLRRIFGPKREEVVGGWSTLHNELHNSYTSPNIIMVIKSGRMRWVGHVARTW